MDNRAGSIHELFSRGSTPPAQRTNFQGQIQQPAPPAPQPPADTASSDLIDSLFHNILPPQDHQSQQPASLDAPQPNPDNYQVVSAPISPAMPLTDELVTSSSSAPSSSGQTAVQERQNALLSLFNNPPPAQPAFRSAAAPSNAQPQQVPTPPGSSRSNVSPALSTQHENQKILLEQLMGSAVPRTNYAESQRSTHTASAPSPPVTGSQREEEYRPYNSTHEQQQPVETSPRNQPAVPPQGNATPQESSPSFQQSTQLPPPPPQPQQQQQQSLPPPPPPQQQQQQQPVSAQPAVNPPSPRRSMFEFMSPFDHLSSTTGSVKKKPVPPQSSSLSSGNDDSSWSLVSDPKRQSVENLLDTLTRGPGPASSLPPHPLGTAGPAYEPYLADPGYGVSPYSQNRGPPVAPPVKQQPASIRAPSPRGPSPTKSQPQPRNPQQQPSIQALSGSNRRDKEGSPARGGARNKNVHQTKLSNKNQSSPGPQSQTIIFDVAAQLEDIQALRESVKSTAIALVRQDSVFLPGTTIGATHWVAYAMTRGRVRVISRSSGDRTLLQLPGVFPNQTSVTDMAVFGNRLAGVTSDGGFVLWELPETITDDVPGHLLLCIRPANSPSEALRAVKWHPKEQDTLAIASDHKVFVIDLANVSALHQPIVHAELHHISHTYTVPSLICAFDFDALHYSLAAITEDSTLTLWNLQDTIPYVTTKVRGDDIPSSITFVDGGIVIGRKNGTIFQLLAHSTKAVLSTIKFINSEFGGHDDPALFGHANYDSRIQTLWIANSRRDSMIACKINIESTYIGGEEHVRGQFEQLVEFVGPKPTIHFVILTADSDPNGIEAEAACIAAKLNPSPLALVAFSVHSSGVDQVLIRKDWFDSALMSARAKFPAVELPPQALHTPPPPAELAPASNKPSHGPLPIPPAGPLPQAPINVASAVNANLYQQPPRGHTPPSDDVENDYNTNNAGRPEEVRQVETKGKGNKGKNVNWKEKDEGSGKDNGNNNNSNKEKGAKQNDAGLVNESAIGQVLTKEIKKTEDNLHSRIGRLISKEMEKQHQRLEEARAQDQLDDSLRQETILKLISTELTRNTTRVVESAVKNEIHASILPTIESIVKHEVRNSLNEQVGRGLVDTIGKNLPIEVEKILTRPDVTSHFAQVLSTNLNPLIERQVKDAFTKSFVPIYNQQSTTLHQESVREMRSEIHRLKNELTAWQNDAFRAHESSIRELEHTVRSLSDQVKFLSVSAAPPQPAPHHHIQQQAQQQQPQGSPASMQGGPHHRQQQQPPANQGPVPYPSHSFQAGPGPAPQQQQQAPPAAPLQQPWYNNLAAPQASHPATIPQPPPPPQSERTPPIKPEQWDEIYLGVLHTQDPSKLRDLLAHSNPDLIMPLNGSSLVSQAVVLTLVHRLSAIIGDTPPNDESFKSSLWWLQRSVAVLRPEDKLITDFIPRVIPNVQHLLNTTKQRLTILPGTPPMIETARTLSDIQENLRRKVIPM